MFKFVCNYFDFFFFSTWGFLGGASGKDFFPTWSGCLLLVIFHFKEILYTDWETVHSNKKKKNYHFSLILLNAHYLHKQ